MTEIADRVNSFHYQLHSHRCIQLVTAEHHQPSGGGSAVPPHKEPYAAMPKHVSRTTSETQCAHASRDALSASARRAAAIHRGMRRTDARTTASRNVATETR